RMMGPVFVSILLTCVFLLFEKIFFNDFVEYVFYAFELVFFSFFYSYYSKIELGTTETDSNKGEGPGFLLTSLTLKRINDSLVCKATWSSRTSGGQQVGASADTLNPFKGHLDCFQILVITNKATLNIVEQVSLWQDGVSFGYVDKYNTRSIFCYECSNFAIEFFNNTPLYRLAS
ncbi:hypothetical protein STEG23_012995, partial [Scotinomys teguina]